MAADGLMYHDHYYDHYDNYHDYEYLFRPAFFNHNPLWRNGAALYAYCYYDYVCFLPPCCETVPLTGALPTPPGPLF